MPDASHAKMVSNCAVCLFFDTATEEFVRELWDRFARAGISSEMPDAGWRPHITLAGCKHLDVAGYESALETFAAEACSLPIVFSSVGCFVAQKSTVFLAPTMTQELLRFHQQHYSLVEAHTNALSSYYLPENWVPQVPITAGEQVRRDRRG